MTDINEFNITDEELREIEQITELAQDCTNNLIDCLVDPDTEEKVELDEEDKKFYEFILESRQILIEQGQKNKGKDKYRENMILNVEYAFAFENREHYMKKENKEVTFCMDEFWAFGMATEIARIMNTTRQNIDRYISSGKIKESRTMDKAIFELLGEDIW